MLTLRARFASILSKISLLAAIYMVFRVLFYLFNKSLFSSISTLELLKINFYGLRFDISAICMLNIAFIVLYLQPFPIKNTRIYDILLKYLFIIVNSIALLFSCADLVYFKFVNKRTTFDVFDLLFSDDMKQMLPTYLLDFWYILLIWFLFIYLLKKIYEFTEPQTEEVKTGIKFFLYKIPYFVVGTLLTIIGFRGGFQLIPIYISTAAEYTSVQNTPLVLNTPFTILKTSDLERIQEFNFMSEVEIKKTFNPIHTIKTDSAFTKKNVVIIIMESFSKEYIGFYNKGKGYTPFLDSLMGHSLVFTQAYANSKRSIEALPAVMASIPTLMNNPFSTSAYGANQITSLASILKEEGYSTAFYHGGANGTMNFDDFCNVAGFDHYYGKDQYPDKNDYDGAWGIWDEPYFQYFSNQLNTTPQPFCCSIFSLSSHHPYAIPEKYKGKFKGGSLPIHITISYADYALKKFFETASKQTWYKNTLFVITADHTSISNSDFYANNMGLFSIPIIFFNPKNETGKTDSTIVQQIDIMPSILNKLNYSKPFYSMGNDMFDSTAKHFAINYLDNIYQLITNNYLLQHNGTKLISVFDIQKDSMLKKNILNNKHVDTGMYEMLLKAFIQTYNHDLLKNKMTVQSNKN